MISQMIEDLRKQGVQRDFLTTGKFLAETKWKHIVEGRHPIEDKVKRYTTAYLLEEELKWMATMDEATRAIQIGDFQKWAFPLIRASFPTSIVSDIVTVQPLNGPNGTVFYQDFVFDSDKGPVRRGDIAFSSVARGAAQKNFAGQQVDGEQIGVGINDLHGISLNWTPLVPGTLSITDGDQWVIDDSNGNLIGDVGANPGTVDYATGTISSSATAVFAAAPAASNPIIAAYQFDQEGNGKVSEMSMIFTSSNVTAQAKKLKAVWSLDAAFVAHAVQGIEAEVEITAACAAEIKHEIERIVIEDLFRIAGAGSAFWNTTQPSGVDYTTHKLTIMDALNGLSNQIFKTTGKARATWIVAGNDVASALETLPGYVEVADVANGNSKGAYRCGRLGNKWDVFKDPFLDDTKFLMGNKSPMFSTAGYMFCPWIPLYATPTIAQANFVASKGLATHFGKKAINGLLYGTGEFLSAASLAKRLNVAADQVPLFGKAARGVYGV